MSDSGSFHLLAPQIQRFIWQQGWSELKDIQEQAIKAVLQSDADVIISAATASGKTEAAFFPAISRLLEKSLSPDEIAQIEDRQRASGVRRSRSVESDVHGLIVYVSPLKALINDQLLRLTLLCDPIGVPVWPWHGDVSSGQKAKFLKSPSGILLITPEALEATLCLRGPQAEHIFGKCEFMIVDETHSFIGSERGKQLQSLMHRIEVAAKRRIRRLGLSATLGDMTDAKRFLRPGPGSERVMLVNSEQSNGSIKILVKGYEEPAVLAGKDYTAQKFRAVRNNALQAGAVLVPHSRPKDGGDPANSLVETYEDMVPDQWSSWGAQEHNKETIDGQPQTEEEDEVAIEDDADTTVAPGLIAQYLFEHLRGSNNLIFPNTRQSVERFTHDLNLLCAQAGVHREFWPHHGSLAKDIRANTEAELKQTERPANGVCTNTLEMGIDIGNCKSIANIGPPMTVASLRQRLGRSGRRAGEPAILRGFVIENEVTMNASMEVMLRTQTLQMAAMVHLLLQKWYEPTVSTKPHFSTFVQQILAVITQFHGLSAGQIYSILCSPSAPFGNIDKDHFVAVLTGMKDAGLIHQDSAGLILLTPDGERETGHYSFYASFASQEEYRVIAGGRVLGTLPINESIMPGQNILFSGGNWRIVQIDEKAKAIVVVKSKGGKPPTFTGSKGFVHTKVRQTMRSIAKGQMEMAFLDAQAKTFLKESRAYYLARNMDQRAIFNSGPNWHLTTWLGDAANNAIALMLASVGVKAWTTTVGVEFNKSDASGVQIDPLDALASGMANAHNPLLLLRDTANLEQEKWDWALHKDILREGYALTRIDSKEACVFLESLCLKAKLKDPVEHAEHVAG